MNHVDILSVALVGGTTALKELASPTFDVPGTVEKRESFVRRVLRAAYRSWVRGGAMVDAMNRSTNDGRHYVQTVGASFQYFGDSSAYRPASARTYRKFEAEHQTLRRILNSAEKFGREKQANQESLKKAS